MTFDDFLIEIDYHVLMLKTILEYKNEDGICAVSQFEIATRINKKQSWVSKAIKRLNAEDTCIEQIEKGKYKIHYTNIKEKCKKVSTISLTLHLISSSTQSQQIKIVLLS